tara:strand:+ start:405 stop:1157 length:753 start_codon:yes stop_codon:yes gene_type:complete
VNFYFYFSKLATPLIIPSNILIFLLIIFFYLGILKDKEIFKKFFSLIFIIFSIISITPIGHNLIYFFLEKNFYDSKVPDDFEFIFVPSGSKNRILTAINIKNNNNDLNDVKIIYSSGVAYLDKTNSKDTETFFTKNLILNSKIQKDDIIFLPEARNTMENFKRLDEFLSYEKKKDSKILLITDAFHMNRSLIIAQKYNLNILTFPSDFITKNQTVGFINSYQNLSVIRNLSKFNLFTKEVISSFFSFFYR